MYHVEKMDALVRFIENNCGIGDKEKLALLVKEKFSLSQRRSLYYCDDFAIRFLWNGKNNEKKISNTALSLEKIKMFDDRPLVLCIVTREKNHLALMNSTFIKKVSHSSKELNLDHIRGSVNVPNIMMEFAGYENEPPFFEFLYAYHEGLGFEENFERIMAGTGAIKGRITKFEVTQDIEERILSSIDRAKKFMESEEYKDLKSDLDHRVGKVKEELVLASSIRNHKLRGGLMEYLITDDASPLKTEIIKALKAKAPLPDFRTDDGLGDFSKSYESYITETDIKTKDLSHVGNPKAYNIDKFLEFLSSDKAVYMIYLLGVDENGKITTHLCSGLDKRLIEASKLAHHWSGQNSRGTVQFIGKELAAILDTDGNDIDEEVARIYLLDLIKK